MTAWWCSAELSAAATAATGGAASRDDKSIEISISPERITVGSEVSLILTSRNGSAPALEEIPRMDNILWENGEKRSSRTMFDGRKTIRENTRVYQFVPLSPGKYTLPSLKIICGKDTVVTQPYEFEVLGAPDSSARAHLSAGRMPARRAPQSSSSVSPDGDKSLRNGASSSGEKDAPPAEERMLFSEISIPSRDRDFYLGEEIPVEIRVWMLDSLRIELSWPRLEAGEKANLVFRDYSAVNRENPAFDVVERSRKRLDGNTYHVYTFRTAFRAISTGTFDLKSLTPATIYSTRGRGSSFFDAWDDPFFFGTPFSRASGEEKLLVSDAGKITVKPLPEAPRNSSFTGLVGLWKTEISLSSSSSSGGGASSESAFDCQVGSPVTLRVKLSGNGSLENLTAPPLEIPDFRCYPPEVEKARSGRSAEIRYVLIPTRQGNPQIALNLSTFNPVSGKYEETSFSKTLHVEKSSGVFAGNSGKTVVDASTVSSSAASQPFSGTEEDPGKRRSDSALYLHKNLGKTVAMPLKRNAYLPCFLMIGFGMAFYLASLLIFARRRAMEKDPAMKRRMEARTRRRGILKKLKASPPEEIADRVGIEIGDYLNDMLNLPPGAGLSDSAAALKEKSPELAETLGRLAESAWMPDLRSSFDQEFKKKLIKGLGRLSVFVLLFSVCLHPCVLSASESESAEGVPTMKPSLPENAEQALTAYDSGDFDGALKFYASKLDPANPAPALLYNMGNCFYHKDDLPRALVCYERALRLAPRNSDILENLNLTRRKMGLEEKYRIEHPLSVPPYLRDSMRPDEWLSVLAFAGMLFLISMGLRMFTRGMVWKPLALASILIAVLAASAALSQKNSSYGEKAAVVVVRNAPVYSLPSEQSGRQEMQLKAGQEIEIEERRLDWVRVRVGADEGWMKGADVESLWSRAPSGKGL